MKYPKKFHISLRILSNVKLQLILFIINAYLKSTSHTNQKKNVYQRKPIDYNSISLLTWVLKSGQMYEINFFQTNVNFL
jgi:hypothetical protein